MTFVYHAGGDRCRVAAFGRDTPARGCGRASLAVGQRVFFLLSHSRRYAIRRVGRLASLVVCRRVVLVVPREGVGLRGERVVPFSSGSAFARSNDREKDTSPRAPRTKGRCARIVPVFVPPRSLTLRARGAAFWVRQSPFKRLANSAFPAPRGNAKIPPIDG